MDAQDEQDVVDTQPEHDVADTDVTDVIVVGAGLAGLVAAAELAEAGRRVVLLDQEGEQDLGGQAYWSFGAVSLIGTPEQRGLGVADDVELAWRDWLATAAFDRDREDRWPRQWARAYVEFAGGQMRDWLVGRGVDFLPVIPWAERRAGPEGPGNSAPRFHIARGTGHGIVEPFERVVRAAADQGLLTMRFRHRVDELTTTGGVVDGVRGAVLEPTSTARGQATSRRAVGRFELRARAVVIASGGIAGDYELIVKNWPERLGEAPERMLAGVPASADGSMLETAARAGASVINTDRMWHYTDGVTHHTPIWPNHGIRVIPGPSALWLDARGGRLPQGPGVDALSKVTHVHRTGYTYSWLVLNRAIAETEIILSGSEENPDLTDPDQPQPLGAAASQGDGQEADRGRFASVPGPLRAFLERGEDFVVRDSLPELVDAMNALTPEPLLDLESVARAVDERDAALASAGPATQQQADEARGESRLGERLVRTATPHHLADPDAGPLIGVRLHLLTRKTLGGLETDLDCRVLRPDGTPIPGLYAAGEAAGFGGGGSHGYRALEGTFLGGCLFTGRQAGLAAAAATSADAGAAGHREGAGDA